mgnify:FL=1
MKQEHKELIIKHKIFKAKETIKDAEIAIKNQRYNNAMNRIYYAIFHIISALSVKYDFSTSKHKQLMGWFNKNFIYTNKIDTKLYKIYSKAFSNRQESDYEDFVTFLEEEVEEHFKDMLYFVSEIEKFINQE